MVFEVVQRRRCEARGHRARLSQSELLVCAAGFPQKGICNREGFVVSIEPSLLKPFAADPFCEELKFVQASLFGGPRHVGGGLRRIHEGHTLRSRISMP